MKYTLIACLTFALITSCGTTEVKSTKKEVKNNVTKTTTITQDPNKKNIKRITVAGSSVSKNVNKEEFAKLIAAKKGILLDVRTSEEFNGGFIEGAMNVDINDKEFKNEINKLDMSAPIYVYCQSGGRSGRAMATMKKMGFKEIYNLKGGYGGWIAE